MKCLKKKNVLKLETKMNPVIEVDQVINRD